MSSSSYRNDFLYVVLQSDTSRGEGVLIYCSGVNVSRFGPITRGRHGIGSNPSVRGLQLVNLGVRDLALLKGSTPKSVQGNVCGGIVPTGDTWYTEALLLENAPVLSLEEIIDYAVINLVRKIFRASMLDLHLPDKPLQPDELQAFLEDLCKKYGGL